MYQLKYNKNGIKSSINEIPREENSNDIYVIYICIYILAGLHDPLACSILGGGVSNAE